VKLNSLLKAKPIILTFAIVCGLTGSHLQSQEKNVPERLDEADLNVIAEIRADRQKLFDDAIAENKSKVSDLQETIRRQKAGKELVVPSWFSLGVMGRMPDYPQLGIKQLEQEMMSQRREAARLKRLTPLEFVVDLIDAYGELNNLNSKIDRDARQVVLGKMQFNVLADFALPLETQYRYTRPDGSQYVDSEAEIGNWMVRNMMEAAIKAAEQQAAIVAQLLASSESSFCGKTIRGGAQTRRRTPSHSRPVARWACLQAEGTGYSVKSK
jgi:hypothetical protein